MGERSQGQSSTAPTTRQSWPSQKSTLWRRRDPTLACMPTHLPTHCRHTTDTNMYIGQPSLSASFSLSGTLSGSLPQSLSPSVSRSLSLKVPKHQSPQAKWAWASRASQANESWRARQRRARERRAPAPHLTWAQRGRVYHPAWPLPARPPVSKPRD